MRAALALTLVVAGSASLSLLRAKERHLLESRARSAARIASSGVSLPADQFFPQAVDHFNVLTSSSTWQQRFWVNDAYSVPGNGLVFLYIEGEGTGSPYDVLEGQHVEYAAALNASVIALEHRFYGSSQPTGDWGVDSMALLSSHQAVADIADFITGYIYPVYHLDSSNSSVVVVGGSYAGAMAAWTRLRLPHLVFAAMSTSSPVQAVADFVGYNNVVAASLSDDAVGGSAACLAAVTSAFQVVDAAMRANASSRAAMSLKLSSCAPSVTDSDAANAVSNAAGQIMGVVQYNDEGGSINVASICDTMTAPGVAPIDALATVIADTLGGAPCMDNSYADFIALLRNTTADPGAQGVGIRQWTWQTCSQFGYYQTCEAGTSCPFSTLMTLNFSFQICVDAFDARVAGPVNTARIAFTDAYMGGAGISSSRIIYTNGGVDPWHTLSVLPGAVQPDSTSLFIPTGAHCRNMQPSSPNDPADVKAARAAALAQLQTWLQGRRL